MHGARWSMAGAALAAALALSGAGCMASSSCVPDATPWGGTIAALYDVISGPAGQPRDWERMRSLFAPGGRLLVSTPRADGSSALAVLTVDDYIARSEALLVAGGFTEREIARRTERWGNIVHVFSTYEGRFTEGGEERTLRGINSIQLVHLADGWKVASILWEHERPDHPLPERYLTSE